MKHFAESTALLFAVNLLCAVALAAQPDGWDKVGEWTIRYDAQAQGCVASTVFPDETSFKFGLTGTDPLILKVVMFNKKWLSLEDGKNYLIKAQFGDAPQWSFDMTGLSGTSPPGLVLQQNTSSELTRMFVDELKRAPDMVWQYKGGVFGNFTLTDTTAAYEKTVACTDFHRDAPLEVDDPFEGLIDASD